MIHPNIGFKDVILEALPDGKFMLQDTATKQPVCPIEFNNRKAARNWAHGRGFRTLEDHLSSEAGSISDSAA